MKETWQEGKIAVQNTINSNHSKQEELFLTLLEDKLKTPILRKQTVYYANDEQNKKYLYPDGLIENKNIIIEYYGDFWHANPHTYKENDIKAKDIWERDNIKNSEYEKLGYRVIIIWQKDFINDKNKCVEDIFNKINDL